MYLDLDNSRVFKYNRHSKKRELFEGVRGMKKLDSNKAYKLFMKWSKENPGTWIFRSINVAEVAKRIAKAIRTR